LNKGIKLSDGLSPMAARKRFWLLPPSAMSYKIKEDSEQCEVFFSSHLTEEIMLTYMEHC
jgi:hypothetical protein